MTTVFRKKQLFEDAAKENGVYPVTSTEAVFNGNGDSLDNILQDLNDLIQNKQDALVSGTSIKTINNQSILGSGNINIQADLSSLATVATTGSYNDLINTPTIGTAASKGVYGRSSVGTLDWGTNNDYLLDKSAMAYWNGAYSGTSSNLAYCNKGAFGNVATKSTNGSTANYLRGDGSWVTPPNTHGSISTTLLWTNSSPASRFGAQRISLTLTSYFAVDVVYRWYTNQEYYFHGTFPKGTASYRFTTPSNQHRGFYADNSGVVVDAGSNSGDSLIPYRVYGIKLT